MITKAERLYYIHPVPTPTIPESFEDVQVLVTYVRYKRPDIQPGDIVKVVSAYTEEHAVWFTTANGGRHVLGHVLNRHDGYNYPDHAIGLVSDELFALYTVNGTSRDKKLALGEVRRWSDPNRPLSPHDTNYGTFPLSAKAAPWADTLMPLPGEREDVVRAKVEQAKVRWEQMQKGLGLIHEGIKRDWLHLLSDLRPAHTQYMPEPRFDQHVTGTVLIPTSTRPTPEQIEQANRRLRLNNAPITLGGDSSEASYISTTATAVVRTDQTWEEAAGNSDSTAFTNAMRRLYNDTQVNAFRQYSTPVLSSLTY